MRKKQCIFDRFDFIKNIRELISWITLLKRFSFLFIIYFFPMLLSDLRVVVFCVNFFNRTLWVFMSRVICSQLDILHIFFVSITLIYTCKCCFSFSAHPVVKELGGWIKLWNDLVCLNVMGKHLFRFSYNSAIIYLFKVNNRNTKNHRFSDDFKANRSWRCSGVFIVTLNIFYTFL